MMKWNGPYAENGSKIDGNKGVKRFMQERKREEAEERNAQTPDDHRRATARAAGYSRHSDWPMATGKETYPQEYSVD